MSTRAVDLVREPAPDIFPRDPVFDRWAVEERFLWLLEHGMGRLLVSDPPYDEGYFQNYVERAATPMGRAITAARLDLVQRFAAGGEVVDIGIGCGAFIEARAGRTWGYDVSPYGLEWLHERGLYRDPYERPVDAVTMWDVLEHLEEPARLLAHVRRWVFLSLPIVPGDGPPPADWRHLKPHEHAWYWTHAGLVRWMDAQGFRCVHWSDVETQLGRLDIGTGAFRREVGR